MERIDTRHRWLDGIDIRKIQLLLGHEKLETTARYLHVATGMISTVESPLVRLPGPKHTRTSKHGSNPKDKNPLSIQPSEFTCPTTESPTYSRTHVAH